MAFSRKASTPKILPKPVKLKDQASLEGDTYNGTT